MNCRDIEPLLLAERDGLLTSGQQSALERHVAACAACQQMRSRLAGALAAFQTDAANVAVPDADKEWRILRAQMQAGASRPAKKRPLAPVIWFGSSLAAAAALAFAFLGGPPKPPELFSPDHDVIAEAEFVEAGDINASTMVYVDKESGWLVVWAMDGDAKTSG